MAAASAAIRTTPRSPERSQGQGAAVVQRGLDASVGLPLHGRPAPGGQFVRFVGQRGGDRRRLR
ncbi:Uncharacterised protein [Bordetella pertussis]|nr:Uncharacterised protein [Bordetella pertussis]